MIGDSLERGVFPAQVEPNGRTAQRVERDGDHLVCVGRRDPGLAEVRAARRELQQGSWADATLRDARFLPHLGQIPHHVFEAELQRFGARGEMPTCDYIEVVAAARLCESLS